MKKSITAIILAGCILLTACGNNAFSKEQYDDNSVIIDSADRYSKTMSFLNSYNDSVTYTVKQFDGRETVWSDYCKEEQKIGIDYTFTISAGKAKLVFIDGDDNITTIVECTPDLVVEKNATCTVAMTKGNNRFKIVGYDCENIDFNMKITE